MDLAVGKLGEDVLLLDLKDTPMIADYFVICSGASERQIEAIQEELLTRLREAGVRALHTEGKAESGWVLVDYGSVVAHIFTPATRRHYSLELLWKDAKTLVRVL